jgi:uncharacterized membrane protein
MSENLSKWTLRKSVMGVPLEFSWVSKAEEPVENKLIAWEAISGLQNRGRVEFHQAPSEDAVDVTMTIDYKLPRVLKFVFRSKIFIYFVFHSTHFNYYQGERKKQ